MAFSVEGNVYVATYVIYDDPADDERYRAWVHERTAAHRPRRRRGVYLGDTDFTRRPDRFLVDDAPTAGSRRSAPSATRERCSPPTWSPTRSG